MLAELRVLSTLRLANPDGMDYRLIFLSLFSFLFPLLSEIRGDVHYDVQLTFARLRMTTGELSSFSTHRRANFMSSVELHSTHDLARREMKASFRAVNGVDPLNSLVPRKPALHLENMPRYNCF